MPIELTAALVVFLAVLTVTLVRRKRELERGPFPDVPSAQPGATPSDAPGLEPPYSSLDPTAPRTDPGDRRGQ